MSGRLRPRARHCADHGAGSARQEAAQEVRRSGGKGAGAPQRVGAGASWRVVSESHKTPPHRKTAAVTIVGALLLLLAVGFAYMAAAFAAHIASGNHPYISPYSVAVGLALAGVLVLAGWAIIGRWRGWRNCA